MFEEDESVPSRDNGIMFKKTNDERTIGCKRSAVANVTTRPTKYTQQSASKGIYSHLLVSKGKGR